MESTSLMTPVYAGLFALVTTGIYYWIVGVPIKRSDVAMSESELKPNVVQMLEIGRDCGLSMLGEAYQNYMNHYDCFFLIEDYTNQYDKFVADLTVAGLVTYVDAFPHLLDMTIEQALIKAKQHDRQT